MISLVELVNTLDQLLNPSLFSDHGPNGLQVEGVEKVKKVAFAVSATEETIRQCIEAKANALVVHHGLFWQRDPYEIVGAKKRKLQLLLNNDISLLAYHLPLDAHPEYGNNWKAATDMGWKELKPFGKLNNTYIGVKGVFVEKDFELFKRELESYYGHPAIFALGGKRRVKSAALISGGAYKELINAAKEGVDCFITGNFDEPAWGWAFEEKINFIAMGHSATERVGVKALKDYLAKTMGIECLFLDIPNPF